MPAVNTRLFTNSPALHVRDVTLLATDDLQTHARSSRAPSYDETIGWRSGPPAFGWTRSREDRFVRPAGGSSPDRLRTCSVRSYSRPVPDNSSAGTSRYTEMRRAKKPSSWTSPWSPFETAGEHRLPARRGPQHHGSEARGGGDCAGREKNCDTCWTEYGNWTARMRGLAWSATVLGLLRSASLAAPLLQRGHPSNANRTGEGDG